jgi:RNA polymerase sigma factor (sigma-70 family)
VRKEPKEALKAMARPWYEPLRKHAKKAFLKHPSSYGEDAVLFYLARWCQKKARRVEPERASKSPDLRLFKYKELSDAANAIASNLAADGKRIEILYAPSKIEYEELRSELLVFARRYRVKNAWHYAEDARQKVETIVLTGTRPTCTSCMLERRRLARPGRPECRGCQLELGVEGPSNEYVFRAPFAAWACTIVRHLIVDDVRQRRLLNRWRWDLALIDEAHYASSYDDDDALLDLADALLKQMLKAVGKLPPRQKSVMILSMCRADVDDLLHKRLHRLAPGLLGGVKHKHCKRFASDEEIAKHLGTTARNVASTRSVARKKLARRNASWGEILDIILPHASPPDSAIGKNG